MIVSLTANAHISANHRSNARQVSAPLGRASRPDLRDCLFLSSANALPWTSYHLVARQVSAPLGRASRYAICAFGY